jgi:SAM-dependent methyltransferase
MSSSERSDSVARNIGVWTRANAEYTDSSAAAAWAADEITWGIWRVPESELGALPEDVDGLDVVELGCGTAYFSAWLAKRGARPVGVDPTPAQLETARRLQAETGIEFPLVEAPGERVPLADSSFDVAISEYGAALWALPELWVAEAARLLRPGGRLVFLTNSVLVYLCVPESGPAEERLQRPQFGMHSIEWPDGDGIEYHLAHADWIRLLGENGLAVDALIEVQAPSDAAQHEYYSDIAAPEWAQKWPTEELWVARKRG